MNPFGVTLTMAASELLVMSDMNYSGNEVNTME
jgi:hypothetical protein